MRAAIGTNVLWALILMLLSVRVAYAGDDAVFFAGGQISGQDNSYSIIGAMAPLPGYTLGSGWAGRATVESLTYRYRSGSQAIDGTAFGGALSGGYQWSNAGGWGGLYAGPSFRYTTLSPDDPTNDARGAKANLRLQAEGEESLTANFKANAIASYESFDDRAYWMRLRLLYRVSGTLYAGPEGVMQGDDTYHGWQTGAVLNGISLFGGSLGFDAGVRDTAGLPTSLYAGVEYGILF